MWFATRYGFCKYDGYQITVYKSSLNTPGLLTSNNIYCFADDNDGFLWIGTQEGLNTLNKKTGEIRQYTAPAIPNNAVSCLLVTRENEVWIGTDSGLCRYVAEKDSFVMYDGKSTDGIFPAASIKSLFEDSDGDLWVGTWSSGLFVIPGRRINSMHIPKSMNGTRHMLSIRIPTGKCGSVVGIADYFS